MASTPLRRAWLGLGGNLGDVEAAFRRALVALADAGVEIVRESSVWRTAPWGHVEQPVFLNMVVEIRTAFEPLELLDRCQALEIAEGRVRQQMWGPRPLDIDILMVEGLTMKTPRLTLPHPRKRERAFVMLPLAEIAPDLLVGNVPVRERARLLDDGRAVRLRALRP